MQRFALTAAMTALLAGTAFAADMPARMPVKAVPYAAYNWTGFYVGLNAGVGFRSSSDSLGIGSNNNSGFVGGGQIGYNWQAMGSPLVLGLEADFQGASQGNTSTLAAVTLDSRLRYFGTIRGRIGYAWDRFMLYGTGGFAYANTRNSLTTAAGTTSNSNTNGGYTLGAGIEYGLAGPWTVGLEYLYVDVRSNDVTVAAVTDSVRLRENVIRAKVNYRF